MNSVRRAAKAIRDQDRETADRSVREIEFADVKRIAPLQLEMQDSSAVLDGDDLTLTAWIRAYDDSVGIAKGDTLAVKPMRHGVWLVLDVCTPSTTALFTGGGGGGTPDDNSVTSAKIVNGTILNIDISSSAAIDISKLASGTSGQIIVADGSGVPTYRSLTGDIGISNTGVSAIQPSAVTNTMLAGSISYSKLNLTGAILNADLAGSIALTKLANVTAGSVVMGNASNIPTATALSGDVTVDSSGVTAIGATKVTNGMLAGSIALTKLATVTPGQVLLGLTTTGVVTATTLTGDVTVDGAGATTIGASKVTSSMLAGSIAVSKLASGTAGQVLINSAGPTPTWTSLSGDVTVDSSGVTTIGATKVTNAMLAGSIAYSKLTLTGAILNADLAGSIAVTKLSPGTTGQVLLNNGTTPTWTTISSDITIGATGVATIANLAVTDAKVATANKDGVAGTASMRTLGTGATQAAAGSHASQHLPGGADALTTAAASTITPASTNTTGTAASFARSDHTHAITSAAASTLTPDSTNTTGTAASVARSDHTHAITSAAASTLSGTNAAGTAASVARSDHNHAMPNWGTVYPVPIYGAVVSATATLDQTYYSPVLILSNQTFTGVRYQVGSASAGNVRSSVYNSSGTRVADRTSALAQAVGLTVQDVPFTSTAALAPGLYWVAITFSSGSATYLNGACLIPSGNAAGAGSGATKTSITPPTAAGNCIVAALY